VIASRIGAVLCATLVLAYPVASYLGTASVPAVLRLVWIALAVAALLRPGASLLAFVAGAPLLPIVPLLAGWPVSLVEQWLLALLVASWLRHARRPGPPVFPRLAWLLLAIVTSSLVVTLAPVALGEQGVSGVASLLHSFLREDFIAGPGGRHMFAPVVAWAVIAEGIGLGWLLWRHLDESGEDGHHQLVKAALTGGVLVSVWAIWQWWTRANLLPTWAALDPFITRVNASFTDVNTLGSYMAALVPVFGGMACLATHWQRRLAWAGGLWLACTAAVFTGSRASWVGLVLGTLACAGLAWRLRVWNASPEGRAHVRRLVIGGAVAAGVLAAALTAYATHADVRHGSQRSYLDAVLYTVNLRVPLDERLKWRVQWWQAGVAMIEAKPLGGIGIGRFYRDLSRYASDPDRLARIQENAHNYPLQLAAECGLPALTAWIALIVQVTWRGHRGARLAGSRRLAVLVAAGAGGTVAILATCLTGHPLLLREGQMAFWIVLAIAAGVPATWRTSRRSIGWFPAALLVVAISTPLHVRADFDGIDWSRRTVGMYPEESDHAGSYRWTKGTSTFYVPQGALTLTFSVRSLAPVAQRIEVSLNGQVLDTIDLQDHDWRHLEFLLPRTAARGRFHEVVLETTPTWTPEGDHRELGVVLRGLQWRP
jgi:hypothetical protein